MILTSGCQNKDGAILLRAKTWMIMKLTIALMLFFTFQVSANGNAQQITIVKKNASLTEIFKTIERQTGYLFFYDKAMIQKTDPIDIAIRNATLEQALSVCLKSQDLTYSIVKNTVVISPEKKTTYFKAQETIVALESPEPPPPVGIHGRVVNEKGEPLQNVSVLIAGTKIGTTTDNDGRFTLTAPDNKNVILEISSIGYQTKTVKLGKQTEINITLEQDIAGLSDVVVVGYGTQKKENLTSAISHVSSSEFTKGVVNSPLQLLEGKVAGLAMSNPSGDPTSSVQINIRGVSTLASSSNPLIVIDGVPGGSLDAIAPEDIASVDVLKGGSAAAIYGSRANGGVIIITTKSSKGNNISVEYSGSVNIDMVEKRIKVFSADEYRLLPEITGINTLKINDRGHNTDWQNEILRTPVNQVQHLAVYGKGDNSSYTASISYRDINGIILNSNKKSLIGRVSVNQQALKDRLRFAFNISDNISNDKQIPYNSYLASLIRNPTDSIFTLNGAYTDYSSEPHNPVGQLLTQTNQNRFNQLLGSAEITAEPIKNLNISLFGAYQRYDNEIARSTNFMNAATTLEGLNGQNWLNGGQDWNRTLTLTTQYTGTYKKHNYTLLGGYTNQNFNNQSYGMYAYNFPTDRFGPWNIGLAGSIVDGTSTMNSDRETSKLAAYFGRINYEYNNKYLLMLSMRKEGSSKFGENHKWGWFPAASIGWRISKEPFFKNIGFVDNLKLRAGYGVTGTQPDANYLSLALLDYTDRAFLNNQWLLGVAPSTNPNPDLRWERKSEWDVGLDFKLFKIFDGSIDYYYRKTSDLLYLYNVPVPPNLFNRTWANVGDIKNEGLEIFLNTILIRNSKLSWSIGGTFSYNTNKLLKFSDDTYKLDFVNAGTTGAPIQQYTHRVEVGQIGNFFGLKSVGLDSDGSWLIETPEGKIVPASQAHESDKQKIGNGIPKMYASLFTNFSYENWDFSLSLRGTFKFQILNVFRMQYETLAGGGSAQASASNFPKTILNKPYGGNTYIQGPAQYVSYFIENGDFVKINNAAIGYTLPFKNGSIKKLRVSVSGLNLYTFTGYKGLDPEVSIKGLSPGMDDSEKYPSIRRIVLGVQLTL